MYNYLNKFLYALTHALCTTSGNQDQVEDSSHIQEHLQKSEQQIDITYTGQAFWAIQYRSLVFIIHYIIVVLQIW